MPIRALYLHNTLAALVFVVGVTVSAAVAAFYHNNWRLTVVREFMEAAAERADTIHEYLKYNDIVLRSVKALYQSSEKVTRREFAVYTAELLVKTPFLRALEWIPAVKAADREAVEREAALEVPGFMFTDKNAQGDLVRAAHRDIYYPILFAEPMEANRAILGKDISQDSARFEAVRLARETGQMRISGIIPLWQNPNEAQAKGAFFVMPVYKGSGNHGEIRGVVASVISLYDLVEEAIKPLRKAGVNLLIHDLSAKNPDESLVYARSTRLLDIPLDEILSDYKNGVEFMRKTQIEVAGRKWEITILPARGYFVTAPGSAFYGILGIGVLLSALLTIFLLNLTTRADVIQRQVTEKTLSLRQLTEKLSQSNTELERFAYVASHDMQEPIRMISSFSKLLKDEYGDKLTGEANEYLGFMTESSTRLQAMVEDLLEYARLGHNATRLEPVGLDAILDDVRENLALPLKENSAQLTSGRLPEVLANPVQVTRLLQNLVANSLRYQRKGVPPVIDVQAEEDGDLWRISVRDNGMGIAAEYEKKVFEPFKRLHTWQHSKGTGMGLAICKTIVENHGGRIWLTSKVGEGTTFHFTLPKRKTEKA